MKQFKRACYLYAEDKMYKGYITSRKQAELFHMDPLSTIMYWKPKYPDPITFSIKNYWKIKGYIPTIDKNRLKNPKKTFAGLFK